MPQSCPTLCDPMDIDHRAPRSMEFSRQEYWRGKPLLSPGGLFNSGIEPRSPELQADSLPSEPPGKPLELQRYFSKFSLKYLEMIFPESQNLIKILHTTLKNLQKKICFNKLFAVTGLFL